MSEYVQNRGGGWLRLVLWLMKWAGIVVGYAILFRMGWFNTLKLIWTGGL